MSRVKSHLSIVVVGLSLIALANFTLVGNAWADENDGQTTLRWYDQQSANIYLARQTLDGINSEIGNCTDAAGTTPGHCINNTPDLSKNNLQRIYDQMIKGAINPGVDPEVAKNANQLGIDLLWKSKISDCSALTGSAEKNCLQAAIYNLKNQMNSILGSISTAEKTIKSNAAKAEKTNGFNAANGNFTRNQAPTYTPDGLRQKLADLSAAKAKLNDSLAGHDSNPKTCYIEDQQGISQTQAPDKTCMYNYFNQAASILATHPEMQKVSDQLKAALKSCNTEACYNDVITKAGETLDKESDTTQAQLPASAPVAHKENVKSNPLASNAAPTAKKPVKKWADLTLPERIAALKKLQPGEAQAIAALELDLLEAQHTYECKLATPSLNNQMTSTADSLSKILNSFSASPPVIREPSPPSAPPSMNIEGLD